MASSGRGFARPARVDAKKSVFEQSMLDKLTFTVCDVT